MMRIFAFLSVLIMLAGCADQAIKGPPVPLGDFKLGHNVVVTKNTQSTVISRNVSDEELVAAAQVQRENRPLLLIDIALPRDVEPAIGAVGLP